MTGWSFQKGVHQLASSQTEKRPVSPDVVYLQQGDIFVTDRPIKITTILGSCLGIVFLCRRLRLGGMAHALFPVYHRDSAYGERYYADGAVRLLYKSFLKRGVDHDEIEVRLFGGGRVIPQAKNKNTSMGELNMRAAKHELDFLGLSVLAGLTGCETGQRLLLDLKAGTIDLQFIQNLENSKGDFSNAYNGCTDE